MQPAGVNVPCNDLVYIYHYVCFSIDITTTSSILIVIEKEAMFQRLIHELPNLSKDIIFLTVSRSMLHFVSRIMIPYE
jgi:hypothetical protein